MLHLDQSRALERAGVKPTLIVSDDAEYKTDQSGLAALSHEALARLKGSVNDLQSLFISTVAHHRAMPQRAVRATKGGIFMGAQAIKAGLADQVGDFDDALAFFRANGSESRVAGLGRDTWAISPPLLALPIAPPASAAGADRTTTPRDAERARLQAILAAPAAQGRAELANYLAFETDMEPAAAAQLLAKAPAASKAVPAPPSALMRVFDDLRAKAEAAKAKAACSNEVATWPVIIDEINRAGRAGAACSQNSGRRALIARSDRSGGQNVDLRRNHRAEDRPPGEKDLAGDRPRPERGRRQGADASAAGAQDADGRHEIRLDHVPN